ncbi:MAG: aminoacyl--tRNA ligase-related protein, partial [Patescibacteria group bacterium]
MIWGCKMLDINFVRQNTDLVKKALVDRGKPVKLLDQALKVDQEYRQTLVKVEKLRADQNRLGKTIHGKPSTDQLKKGSELKVQLKKLEIDLTESIDQLKMVLEEIPNLSADDVPIGRNDEDNIELRKVGEAPKFDFKPKDHLELGESLGIIDVKRAAKVSGSRFGYFVGDGALLEMALMWYVFGKLAGKGFVPVIPPVIVKKEMEKGLGYLVGDDWSEMYLFEKDETVFVSSSEHSVIPMHADEVLLEKDLPTSYANFSTCFRREAGSYGKDTSGMFRVHQFNKVEMNVFTVPDVSVSDKKCL